MHEYACTGLFALLFILAVNNLSSTTLNCISNTATSQSTVQGHHILGKLNAPACPPGSMLLPRKLYIIFIHSILFSFIVFESLLNDY
jgi:hypothetical protein